MANSQLHQLYMYGCAEGLFEVTTLNQITATVCEESAIDVIDFDKTKERVAARLGLSEQPKSCDALKVVPEQNRIVFIEMKSFARFKKWRLERVERKDHISAVRDQVFKFDLARKFTESNWILNHIWIWSPAEKDEQMIITDVVLTDISLADARSSEDLIEFNIFYLADEAIIPDRMIQAEMLGFLERNFAAEQKPLLMDCRQLNDWLS